MLKRTVLWSTPVVLMLASCGSAESGSSSDEATTLSVVAETDDVPAETDAPDETDASVVADASVDTDVLATGGASCESVAALFTTRGSANPDLDDPESSAVCDGDSIVISSNGIPDYTYIETSPGSPRSADHTFTITANPTLADSVTAVPDLGTAAVALNGVPIYGPTEGTGGDVLSLVGATSECGSHNGPTGFHIHLVLQSENTDCLFTPAEVAAAPQLVGYALDGYPIYTGNDQYTSSWELTDESLFATDTWAAHSYVEGVGDLDECNGMTDADGNYAYFTTDTFPYVIGCYAGVVDLDAAGGGGGGGGGEGGPPPGEDG